MILKLKYYVPNDGVFPIYYNGLKAIISHDCTRDTYVIIIVEDGKYLANKYIISDTINTDEIDYNIYPRQCNNIRGEWKELIKLKQDEIQF